MIPATPADIRAACVDRSETDAVRFLASIGLQAGFKDVRATIKRMNESGERMRKPNPIVGGFTEIPEVSRTAAEIGCRQLEDRMNALYDRIVDERRCSFEAAKMACLYSRAQIEKMVAHQALASHLRASFAT